MIAVLLVDDHEAFLAFVKHGLIRQGYTPVTAASGAPDETGGPTTG